MSPADHRRVLRALAHQLKGSKRLLRSERDYLAYALLRIAKGEDANAVLNVKRARGSKAADDIARQRTSMILHWVACAIAPDPLADVAPMSLTEACKKAEGSIVPLAKLRFPGADHHPYDEEYIRECWKRKNYRHMRNAIRGLYDPDFPYDGL